MINLFAIRIDTEYTDSISVVSSFTTANATVSHALGFERGKNKNNPHHHIYLETQFSESYVRKIIRKYKHKGCDKKGNAVYSCTRMREPPKVLAYIMKEDKNFVLENIPLEIVSEAVKMSENWVEDKKKVMLSLKPYCEGYTERPLLKRIVDYHLEKDLLIRRHMVETYYWTLMCHDKDGYDAFIDLLVSQTGLKIYPYDNK